MGTFEIPAAISRRRFLRRVGTAAGLALMGVTGGVGQSLRQKDHAMKIQIQSVDSTFEREPLVRPFGFKGGYVTDLWQTAAWMQSQSGTEKIGLCTQNVLWSDAGVFAAHSEDGGNALMYVLTERALQMGYSAIALKAIAKTLSMTMKIARTAHEHNVPCFCADLTVNPILVEWNKNVAARLAPFPELGMGLLETNGHQNYREWDTMVGYHPCSDAGWRVTRDGLFQLSTDFYDRSGCVFEPSEHYQRMFSHHS